MGGLDPPPLKDMECPSLYRTLDLAADLLCRDEEEAQANGPHQSSEVPTQHAKEADGRRGGAGESRGLGTEGAGA